MVGSGEDGIGCGDDPGLSERMKGIGAIGRICLYGEHIISPQSIKGEEMTTFGLGNSNTDDERRAESEDVSLKPERTKDVG